MAGSRPVKRSQVWSRMKFFSSALGSLNLKFLWSLDVGIWSLERGSFSEAWRRGTEAYGRLLSPDTQSTNPLIHYSIIADTSLLHRRGGSRRWRLAFRQLFLWLWCNLPAKQAHCRGWCCLLARRAGRLFRWRASVPPNSTSLACRA